MKETPFSVGMNYELLVFMIIVKSLYTFIAGKNSIYEFVVSSMYSNVIISLFSRLFRFIVVNLWCRVEKIGSFKFCCKYWTLIIATRRMKLQFWYFSAVFDELSDSPLCLLFVLKYYPKYTRKYSYFPFRKFKTVKILSVTGCVRINWNFKIKQTVISVKF